MITTTEQSIAHGTRHIIAEMNKAGYSIDTILLTGGSILPEAEAHSVHQ
jgi:ribulose kinase